MSHISNETERSHHPMCSIVGEAVGFTPNVHTEDCFTCRFCEQSEITFLFQFRRLALAQRTAANLQYLVENFHEVRIRRGVKPDGQPV